MNVLDENFPDDERLVLLRKGIHVRQIGRDIGIEGMGDDQIIPLLHGLDRPTFFTHDEDFYRRRFCHQGYCLVNLAVDEEHLAEYVLRVLRHPALSSKAKRMGQVIQAQPTGLTVWRIHAKKAVRLDWD